MEVIPKRIGRVGGDVRGEEAGLCALEAGICFSFIDCIFNIVPNSGTRRGVLFDEKEALKKMWALMKNYPPWSFS